MKKTATLIITLLFSLFVSFGAQKTEPLKVGILSDVHINTPATTKHFVLALEYFKAQDVDAIMIVGDMIGWGLDLQLDLFVEAWDSVFPDDTGLNGKKIVKLFVYGNHEMQGHTYKGTLTRFSEEEIADHCINPRKEEIWETYFHEKFEPIYMKDVKGYKFIGAHYQTQKATKGLEHFFHSVEKQLPKDKPFFYFQHVHPAGTVSLDLASHDNGSSTELLGNYPNVIVFSGHSHISLTDERTIWQGGFTSVGTGSLAYGELLQSGEYENGLAAKGSNIQMSPINKRAAHQGMLMTVYKDRIELLRHEFGYDEDLGTWIIPLQKGEEPYLVETRMNNTPAPQFEKDAVVRVGRKEDGKNRCNEETAQVIVKFPSIASSEDRPRAYAFTVDAEIEENGETRVVLSKKVFSSCVMLGEKRDVQLGSKCVFAVDELPAGVPVRFAVYPANCWGSKGNPIRSAAITL